MAAQEEWPEQMASPLAFLQVGCAKLWEQEGFEEDDWGQYLENDWAGHQGWEYSDLYGLPREVYHKIGQRQTCLQDTDMISYFYLFYMDTLG